MNLHGFIEMCNGLGWIPPHHLHCKNMAPWHTPKIPMGRGRRNRGSESSLVT